MRSATYNEFGKPSEVLSITDSPTPEPKKQRSPYQNHPVLYSQSRHRDHKRRIRS